MEFRVAICEDNGKDARFVTGILEKWASERQINTLIEHFTSAESFLFRYAEDKAWDILLLDIEMNGMDGVTLAKQIRETSDSVQIVFITGFPDYIGEGYEVAALHYLMKPVREDKLSVVLDRAVNALYKGEKEERTIVLPTEDGKLRVSVADIIYTESFGHNVKLITKQMSIMVKVPISRMEELLGEEFVRCHRSYIVSVKYIARLSKAEILLDNGEVLPLSRSAVPNVQKAFVAYYTEGDTYEII